MKNLSKVFLDKHLKKKKKYLKKLQDIEFQNSVKIEFLLPFTDCKKGLGLKPDVRNTTF